MLTIGHFRPTQKVEAANASSEGQAAVEMTLGTTQKPARLPSSPASSFLPIVLTYRYCRRFVETIFLLSCALVLVNIGAWYRARNSQNRQSAAR